MSDNLATSIAALPLRAFPGARCRSARGPIIIYFCYAASGGRLAAYFASHRAMPECFWTIVFGIQTVINSLVKVRVPFFSYWLALFSNLAVKYQSLPSQKLALNYSRLFVHWRSSAQIYEYTSPTTNCCNNTPRVIRLITFFVHLLEPSSFRL